MFIVLEGPEATGKTTQAKLLAAKVEAAGHNVVLTKEPGSQDPLCKQIRQLLLSPESKPTNKTALLLFLADRAQHMEEVGEALAAGKVVVSDRSSYSSFVYHAAALPDRSLSDVAAEIAPLLNFAQSIRPDHAFVCHADYQWCRTKLAERGSPDRIEQLGEGFHQRTHQYFNTGPLFILNSRMSNFPHHTHYCLPADQHSPEEISQQIFHTIEASLGKESE